MRRTSTVVLSYPPASSVWHLPMGIGYLAGILQQNGHHVVQEYGYIKGVEHVLRRHGGAAVERQLRTIRDPEVSVFDRYEARISFEELSQNLGTIETFVVERNNVRCDSRHFKGGIDELTWVLENRTEHVFFDYFANVEVPRAARLQPDIYGISVADERQLVSGCILASLVKEAMPGTLVVLGGNYWARVLDAYRDPRFARLFDYWDGIVYAEGYQPIADLAAGSALSQTAGTVWRDGAVVRMNPRSDTPVLFDDLPTPVFARDVQQWSMDFVPPLYTMSNCPMRCSFCSIAAGSDTFLARPRTMSPERVADHMVALGARRFDFVDEFLTISRQLAIGEELARRGYKASWQCYLTVSDKLLDPDVCAALAAHGCSGVQLGLESLDLEILQQEAKSWNHPKNYGRILKNLHDAGIQTHVFIIVGVPNEPINQSLRWLAFLEEYGEYILTIKSGRYRLTRRAPDEGRAHLGELYGIQASQNDDLLLNLNRDQFTYTTHGLSRKRVEAVRDLLEEACRRHWAYQVTSTIPWWTNRGHFTLGELRAAADMLAAAAPREPSIPPSHLKRALAKTASAVRDETGLPVRFDSYEDARNTSRELLGDTVGAPL
jgi:Radical SAM superfamily